MSDERAADAPAPGGETDPDTQRQEMFARWEVAAAGWGRKADDIRRLGMEVSTWMIEQLALQPGQRVLELAAGPGDTGFLAAELIRPGGTLITSDGAEAMLQIARERAQRMGIDNVEFRRLELEWIDLPSTSIDAILCRWGVMLTLDPAAALQEMRRVLRPGGRVALAVWDSAARNPWATVPGRALIELGLTSPPDPRAPGMFALAPAERLQEAIEAAGFVEVTVDVVDIDRGYPDLDSYLDDTCDLSRAFSDVFRGLEQDQQQAVRRKIEELSTEFAGPDGSILLPGRSLVASASG